VELDKEILEKVRVGSRYGQIVRSFGRIYISMSSVSSAFLVK
jgi:hypothetical protein